MEISREMFWKYENVRSSGVTNMFDVRMVSMLSGLSRDSIMYIMQKYEDLMIEFPDVRK